MNFDKKEVVHLQSVEEKLAEAEKALQEGKTYAEEDVIYTIDEENKVINIMRIFHELEDYENKFGK